MSRPQPDAPRGVLSRTVESEGLLYERFAPLPAVLDFVAHFWCVHWDRRGRQPFLAETLPHPCVQVLFEGRGAHAVGVQTRRFQRWLRGTGRVFGIKFRAATFHPILGYALSRLANRAVSLRSVFGPEGTGLKDAILKEPSTIRCVELAEAFLAARLPPLPAATASLRNLVEQLALDQNITRVEQAAELAGQNVRTLQRSFRSQVGISPKWVIQRYRLHEVAERLKKETAPDFSHLALKLGYFDQPHFIRSFKAATGRAPGDYFTGRRGDAVRPPR